MNSIYTLQVDIGRDIAATAFGGSASLYINGTRYTAVGTEPTPGNWSTFTATYISRPSEAGKEIYILLETKGGQGNFDNVRLSVDDDYSYAPPVVWIDSPSGGSVIRGPTVVSGWAIDFASLAGTAISGVKVMVDGTFYGNATYGLSRPDVCYGFTRPGCPNVGFSFQLNAALLTAGWHTVTVVATDSDGTPEMASDSTFVLVPIPVNVFIDAPAAGSTLSENATISGWAIDNAYGPGTAISAVQVSVDGIVQGNATYGLSRPDVCNVFRGRPGCPNVGYSFTLNIEKLGFGSHYISVTASDSDGVPDMGLAFVDVKVAAQPPTVFIDSPTSGTVISGPVTIAGWAVDSASGTGIGVVNVMLDETPVGLATYGSSRPDVCNALPGRPGCPNVWLLLFTGYQQAVARHPYAHGNGHR